MNMTQTTASQICNRQYTDAANAELQRIAASPAMPDEIAALLCAPPRKEALTAIYQVSAMIAAAPIAEQGTLLYELFAALLYHGVDVFGLVPCVMEELANA